jgi:cell wall-associated NlpC family hydrolase
MEIPPHATGSCPSGSAVRRTRSRHKQVGRKAPQAATCLLAATVLMAVPAIPAEAAPSGAAPQRARSQPDPASQRIQVDAATLRKVKAYQRYRRKIARQRERAMTAVRFARRQIGKPYGWGATGPNAYDCSGLVMKSWQKAGVRLPRVTYSQYREVPRKVGRSALKPGDLVFFHGLGHVGMMVSKNRYIHAPNRGRTIRIDRFSGYRKRAFAGAVRPGAPAKRSWPESIIRLARRLEAGTLGIAPDDGPERRGAGPRRFTRHVTWSEGNGDRRTRGRGNPEPRPHTAAVSSGDTPGVPDDLLKDALPEASPPREEAPPGADTGTY